MSNVEALVEKLTAAEVTIRKLDADTGMAVSKTPTNGVIHIFPFQTKGMGEEDVARIITRMRRVRKGVT